MKRLSFLMMAMLFCATSKAATYFFSTLSGDDSRTASQAQDSLTPWKSLSQLNTFFLNLNPGDSVLFKSGEVFDGSLQITRSGLSGLPIVFSSYGSGNKPVINGLTTLTDWVQSDDGIWKSACSACGTKVNQLIINDVPQQIGRFPNTNTPNKGYLTLESHNGNNQITDNELSDATNWTGGDVVIRKNRWIIDSYPITEHAANTLTYKVEGFNYAPNDQYGYFIQNHPQTLDQQGEWYFDPNQKIMQLYFGANSPASSDIKVSVIETLVTLHDQSFIEFNNLSFTGANKNAFDIYNAKHVTIANCSFNFSGITALSTYITQYLTLENTDIQNSNNDALLGYDCSNAILRNNKINNTGVFRGMGGNNDDAYQAIIIRGNNNRIEFNEIDSTGYIPIRFEGNSVVVKNNFINNFALVKDDGGGIYTWHAGEDTAVNYDRQIIGNIVLNGKGDGAGTNSPSYLPANGIYVDGNAGHVDIISNTVANCSLGGIFFNNPHDNLIEKNTVYNNGNQLFMEHIDPASTSFSGNNTIRNNILFSKASSQFIFDIESVHDNVYTMGSFDSNYYSRPVDDNFVIYNSYIQNEKNFIKAYDLQSWQASHGQDISSTKSPVKIPSYTVNNTVGDKKYDNSSFDNNIGGLYAWSPEGYFTAAWANNGKLDGGALQVSFNGVSKVNNVGFVIIGIGAVQAGESYIIKFSLAGSDDYKHAGLFLRKSQAPYNNLSSISYCMINSTRSEKEFLLTANETQSDASLVFQIEEQSNPVYIDNIVLQQANVTIADVEDDIIFDYNASNYTKTITLDGTYVDAKNNLYSDRVTLDPYSSIILLKQPPAQPSLELVSLSGNKVSQSVNLQWNITNEPAINNFDVERSTNAAGFTKIGSVTSSPNTISTAFNYVYTDKNPVMGNNVYRIKLKTSDGKNTYTKSVRINYLENLRMGLSPNPAKERINIEITGLTDLGKNVHVLIESASGTIVKIIPLLMQNQHIIIDISSLRSGIYFAILISDDIILNQQQFIKL